MTGSGDTVSDCEGELVSVEAVATCDEATRAKIRAIKAKQPTVARKLGDIGEFDILSIIWRSQQRLLSCFRGMGTLVGEQAACPPGYLPPNSNRATACQASFHWPSCAQNCASRYDKYLGLPSTALNLRSVPRAASFRPSLICAR